MKQSKSKHIIWLYSDVRRLPNIQLIDPYRTFAHQQTYVQGWILEETSPDGIQSGYVIAYSEVCRKHS